MRYPAFVRAAALALPAALLFGGAAQAQAPAPTQPQPLTMTDTAPSPAQERASVGAVILVDEPVLAQREQMKQLQARAPIVDTTSMGAGPAYIVIPKPLTRQERRQMEREKVLP